MLAVAHYPATHERNPKQFDGVVLRARRDLKHLYASPWLKPGERAQAILFAEQPPEDSPLAALKRLARAESADEQAQIILDHKIPDRADRGPVRHVTPALLVALIAAARGLVVRRLHIGVSPDGLYGSGIWEPGYQVPQEAPGDPCDYRLTRPLSLMLAALAPRAITDFFTQGRRFDFELTWADLKISYSSAP